MGNNHLEVAHESLGIIDYRDWKWVFRLSFADEIAHGRWPFSKPVSYFIIPAGTGFNPEHRFTRVEHSKPIFKERDFFGQPNLVVLDIGCGRGVATTQIARRHPQLTVIGIDNEFGNEIPYPPHKVPNLRFRNQDWESMKEIETGSVDRVLATESVGRYGPNDRAIAALNRVTKIGTLLRATQGKTFYRNPNFDDLLAQHGWDVYVPAIPQRIVIAQRKF